MPKYTSDFALIDVKVGREELAKLCETQHGIPFIVTGYIQPGAGGVGRDDGTSREFSATVSKIVFNKPIKMPCDKLGRQYARAGDVKAGDTLQCDGGFTCLKKDAKRVVKRRKGKLKHHSPEYAKSPFARLYIDCKCGGHNLDGQLGDHGELVGLYPISP